MYWTVVSNNTIFSYMEHMNFTNFRSHSMVLYNTELINPIIRGPLVCVYKSLFYLQVVYFFIVYFYVSVQDFSNLFFGNF